MMTRKKEEILDYLKDSIKEGDIVMHKLKIGNRMKKSYIARVED